MPTAQGTIRNQRIQDGTGSPSCSTRIRTRAGPYPWVPQMFGDVRVQQVRAGTGTDSTGSAWAGHGSYGHGTRGRTRANGICAETLPMGDTRGPGSRAHRKPASRGAVGGRPGERGSCACTCTQGRMYHAAWYMRMRMHMASDMRMHITTHVGIRMACGRMRHEHGMHSCARHAHGMLVSSSDHAHACKQALIS